MTATPSNIAAHLIEQAKRHPHTAAVTCALGPGPDGRRRYTHLTFAQLNRESAQIALGLKRLGLKQGTRAAVMVRPGPDLFALTFGLFKAGIAPVLIDPGMNKRDLKACIREAAPEAFIGIPLAHAARKALGWGRGSVQHRVCVGGGKLARLWGESTLDDARALGADAPDDYLDMRDPDALAAVLFTSGSTGTPKGALYLHRHFAAQVELLRATYEFTEGVVDVPTFPLFALFDPALGMSAVFPRMDYSAPAKADPEEIFAVVNDFGARHMFCSPALLRKLAAALPSPDEIAAGAPRRLQTLERVISAGAPVPAEPMARLRASCAPGAEVFTPYGATESLPVSSVSCSEVLAVGASGQAEGRGVCVGRVTPGVWVGLLEVSDAPVRSWSEASWVEVGSGEVGEVVVGSGSTTQGYLRGRGDELSKIQRGGAQPQGQPLYHRMGDIGYFDAEGRLWLCGRKSHRVEWEGRRYLPLCVEGVLNTTPGVQRTALASTTRGPVICVELSPGASWPQVEGALRARAAAHPVTRGLTRFLRHSGFPVDTRHNSKIKREVLSLWAESRPLTLKDSGGNELQR